MQKNVNSKKVILDICGGTGAWSKYYKENGYDVRVLTLPETDIMDWTNKNMIEVARLINDNKVYGILVAPPCTDFSIARNDKTAKRPRDLKSAMKIVNQCLSIIHLCLYNPYRIKENSLKFWALENPYSGYLKRFLGKPALVFEPYEYGDPYTKKTALWDMFNEPKKNIVEPKRFERGGCFVENVEDFFELKKDQIPENYQKKTGLSKRTIVRSITPNGFAKAFYEANI